MSKPQRTSRATRTSVIVGRRPVLEAVRAGATSEVLVAGASRPTEPLRELRDAAARAGVPVTAVDGERIQALARGAHHQGVAARVTVPGPLSEGDLERFDWPEDPLVVVLDGVTDPQNLGAVARTAEASGASALVVRRPRGATVGPASIRASAGALLHLPVAEVANVPRALGRLKGAGFWVAGLDGTATVTVAASEPPPGALALVVGSEGGGLSRLARERCDVLLRIPMRGRVESLNVAVAAGVGLFGYAERRREEKQESDA